MLETTRDGLERAFGISAPVNFDSFFVQKTLPHRAAPVMVDVNGRRRWQVMNFSLIPSWSKEPRVKFATHNARLETIDQKPTWKKPFVSKRCLVPLSHFIEPIYTGEYAGYMVAFHEVKQHPLAAAGIWDEWVDRNTGECRHSFSIITHIPGPFVSKIGHDRQPLFLPAGAHKEWLACEPRKSEELKTFLLTNQIQPDLSVFKERAMKPGWEKRKG